MKASIIQEQKQASLYIPNMIYLDKMKNYNSYYIVLIIVYSTYKTRPLRYSPSGW